MKRILMLLLAACMLFGVAGCAAKRESAESVVSNAIEAVKTYDSAKAREYWGNENLGDESENDISSEALTAMFSGIFYKILGSEESENTATVDVDITNTDMSEVMTDVAAEVFPALLAEAFKPEAERMGDDDTNKLFSDKLLEMLKRPDNPTITNNVKVTLTLQDDAWAIDSGNDDAIDAMLGGISSFADAMSGAFSGNMDLNDGGTIEQTTEEKLFEIRNWLVGDIWNDGFCDLSHYYSDGKGSIGQTMDAEFSLEQLAKAMEKKSEYNEYINNLPEEYSEITSIWIKLSSQIDTLYAEVQSRGAEVTGNGLDAGLYSQYFNAFDDAYSRLD